MWMKTFGKVSLELEQRREAFLSHSGLDFFHGGLRTAVIALPYSTQRLRARNVLLVAGFGQLLFEVFASPGGDSIGLLTRHFAQSEQVFQITFTHRLAPFDRSVEHRLGKVGSSPSLWPSLR